MGYSNMKLIYICRALFKNGGLKERPLTENAGRGVLSERPLTGKTGDLGVKNNKETYIFLNDGLFDLPRSKKQNKELYIFEKGVFWSSLRRNGRVAKSEKWRGGRRGGFRAAHTRTVLIWEYPPSPGSWIL